jgi:hypothetical protein
MKRESGRAWRCGSCDSAAGGARVPQSGGRQYALGGGSQRVDTGGCSSWMASSALGRLARTRWLPGSWSPGPDGDGRMPALVVVLRTLRNCPLDAAVVSEQLEVPVAPRSH